MAWFTSTIRTDSVTAKQKMIALIEELLEKRERLIPLLEALVAELPRGSYRKSLHKLLGKIRSEVKSEELFNSRDTLATITPLIAAFHSVDSKETKNESGLNRIIASSLGEDFRRRSFWQVMSYPLTVALIAFAMILCTAYFIVPPFTELFADFGIELPASTELLVAISCQLQQTPIRFFAMIACVSLVSYLFYVYIERIPLVGSIVSRVFSGSTYTLSAMSTYLERLSELLSVGLPIADAIGLAGQLSPSPLLAKRTEQLSQQLMKVGSFHGKLPANRFLPATVIEVLTQHEEQLLPEMSFSADSIDQPNEKSSDLKAIGSTCRSLRNTSDLLCQRIEDRFNWNSGLVAKFTLIVVGSVVGFIVMALMVPLVSLIQNLS